MSDAEGECVAPYLTLLAPEALQRKDALRAVFNAVRWLVRTGAPWRYLPGDFPPWPAVSQPARRWLDAGCCAALVPDLRMLLRVLQARTPPPTATSWDARVLHSRPESGARAGYHGSTRRTGSTGPAAVATLGHRLAVVVTPANADARTQGAALAEPVQHVTGQHVKVACVDHGDTGEDGATTAAAPGLQKASSWRWSTCRRPRAASCSCPRAGSWSAAAPGRPASVGWRATRSGGPACWPACTSWPSPASCSISSSISTQVHNTL